MRCGCDGRRCSVVGRNSEAYCAGLMNNRLITLRQSALRCERRGCGSEFQGCGESHIYLIKYAKVSAILETRAFCDDNYGNGRSSDCEDCGCAHPTLRQER